MSEAKPPKTVAPWRQKLWTIIFESDTPAGKAFDVVLLVAILASVSVVLLESLPDINPDTARVLFSLEFGFTILFTFEYLLRLISVRRPLRYMISFYGIVDFMAIIQPILLYLCLELNISWSYASCGFCEFSVY
jgi:voltage-gated potassium channel